MSTGLKKELKALRAKWPERNLLIKGDLGDRLRLINSAYGTAPLNSNSASKIKQAKPGSERNLNKMSYYDPRIYNYSNLEEKDKKIIDLMVATALDSMEGAKNDFEDDLECEGMPGYGVSLMDRIKSEERIAGISHAEELFVTSVMEIIVAWIDDYDHDVPEVETNDYFYGFDWPAGIEFSEYAEGN